MDLEIEGRHTLLFDDDASAAFVNSRAALVPWNGDESLLIDRYDGRHLLDRIPPRTKRQRFVEDTGGGISLSDLDRERFLDLPSSSNDDDADADGQRGTTEKSDIGSSYQAVAFSYGNVDGQGDDGSGSNPSVFHPPFPVPSSLLSNLPQTEKLHQIMARTALFVSKHGGQSEIVLRVKQGGNPTFGFLMPDNQLHPYFRFLVDHPKLLKADSSQEEKKPDVQEGEDLVASGGALSLLGSIYGTGEDDENTSQQEPSQMEINKLNDNSNSELPRESVKEENVHLEDKELTKRVVGLPTKEESFLPKKSHFINTGSISKKAEVTSLQQSVGDKSTPQLGKTDDPKLIIWEPPSFLKKTMDKIVEFIVRNGKEFEAILIEQDKTAGRFPFLLTSNQYRPYYQKVLQEAFESKLLTKNPSEGSKRRTQETLDHELTAEDELEGRSLDPQRKEKFKMVIGSKKESDQFSKPVRQSGATADEAAAIVLAATRGRSPASAFQSTSFADSDTGRASSPGSLSLPLSSKPVLNPPASSGEAGSVALATAIAKTVAVATASEADSSEASLTKEQKLKAERLKRAKMFAAMIKSGHHPTTQLVNSGGTPNGSVEPCTAGSNHDEREGSCVPANAEAAAREKNYRKKQHSDSKDSEEDSKAEHKHSRKKLRSDDLNHHMDKESKHHSRRRHKHHSDSEDDERRHGKSHRHHHHRHHKHSRVSDDEDRHGKSSGHRHRRRKHDVSEDDDQDKSRKHRRRKHDLSEDGDRDRSHKHRRKHRSPSEKVDEVEEGEVCDDHDEKTITATASEANPPDIVDVPSDLRAKIRAMLLETI